MSVFRSSPGNEPEIRARSLRHKECRGLFSLASDTALFDLGFLVGTPAATVAMQRAGVTLRNLVERHAQGDFGIVNDDEVETNLNAIDQGGQRIVSMYRLFTGAQVIVMTESDRSVTTIFTPDEW